MEPKERPGSHLQAVTALLHQARPAAWGRPGPSLMFADGYKEWKRDWLTLVRAGVWIWLILSLSASVMQEWLSLSSCTALSLDAILDQVLCLDPQIRCWRDQSCGFRGERMQNGMGGTVFVLLWKWATQSNPSSLSLLPQRFHRELMLLTFFSYCSGNCQPRGPLCVCVPEIKGRVWEIRFILYVLPGKRSHKACLALIIPDHERQTPFLQSAWLQVV